jgi:hypothetical protein
MRKAFIYTIVILGLLESCRAQKIDQEMIYGTFTGSDKNHTASSFYTLELKSDGTFSFDRRVHLGGSRCDGKWRVTDNKVLLECSEVTDPMETLTRGGMNGVQELQMISKSKLKYKDVVLRRKK